MTTEHETSTEQEPTVLSDEAANTEASSSTSAEPNLEYLLAELAKGPTPEQLDQVQRIARHGAILERRAQLAGSSRGNVAAGAKKYLASAHPDDFTLRELIDVIIEAEFPDLDARSQRLNAMLHGTRDAARSQRRLELAGQKIGELRGLLSNACSDKEIDSLSTFGMIERIVNLEYPNATLTAVQLREGQR